MDNGDIEVELYDHSEAAQSSFGGDVSTIYTVDKVDLPELAKQLAVGFGGDIPSMAKLPDHLTRFFDVQSLIEWLTSKSGLDVRKRG
ncbi:hypothetical protein H8K38_17130 [Undibacterium sp. FT79W]|jgi:hypothetical protein|uniref:hypothetical protein n=1 Tax=Undibacterium sp. FT79W TaxID=2762296 RepID=UPI00164B827D|nr:hypothetical protein [Undibacterium sp. FT79W]MBC3879535.1 hypothetical protein [Undibacterium sp. FT79W]